MKPIVLALTAALALQACTSVVMSTAAMLNATSPMEADPAGFEIAIDMPDGVFVPTGGATMGLTNAHSKLGETYDETYALQQRSSQDGQTLFRIHPDDLDDIRAFQARAVTWETEDPEASTGSFSVSVSFCKIGEGPAPDDRFSVSIRTETDGMFLPLIRNAKVADALNLITDSDDTTQTASRCP